MKIRIKTVCCAERKSFCECARQPHGGRHVCGGKAMWGDEEPCRAMWDDEGTYRLPGLPRGYSRVTDLLMDLWVAAR